MVSNEVIDTSLDSARLTQTDRDALLSWLVLTENNASEKNMTTAEAFALIRKAVAASAALDVVLAVREGCSEPIITSQNSGFPGES